MYNKSYLVTLTYYCVLILALLAAMLGYYLTVKQGITLEECLPLETFLILFTIISIPLSLKFFANNTAKIENTEGEVLQERMRVRNGILRNAIIGLGFIINIFFFYLLQEKSLLYMAAISAIALFFAKPRKRINE